MTYVDTYRSTPNDGAVLSTPSRGKPVLSMELHTAASTIAIPTIRTVAADLAARADFDLDSIDDLRMAVDDACAMLVRIAVPGGALSCRFTVRTERIQLAVEVDAADSEGLPPTGSFAWQVLESLTDEVSAQFLPSGPRQHGGVCIALAKDAATTGRS